LESLSRNFSQHLSPSALYSRVTTSSRYHFHSHPPSFGPTKWPPNARSSRVLLASLLYTLFSLFLSQLTIGLWSTKMRPNLLQFVALASAGVIKHKPGPNDIFSCVFSFPLLKTVQGRPVGLSISMRLRPILVKTVKARLICLLVLPEELQ
jgi:hypothetical protein